MSVLSALLPEYETKQSSGPRREGSCKCAKKQDELLVIIANFICYALKWASPNWAKSPKSRMRPILKMQKTFLKKKKAQFGEGPAIKPTWPFGRLRYKWILIMYGMLIPRIH